MYLPKHKLPKGGFFSLAHRLQENESSLVDAGERQKTELAADEPNAAMTQPCL